MGTWKEWLHRLRYLGRRDHFDRELDEEIQFHIEERIVELEQQGISRAVALLRARREFGPRARAIEDTRSAWQIHWLEDLFSDLRYAARALRRNPGFTLTAVASLALGIGMNTTAFSLTLDALFSQPSCRAPETLVSTFVGGSGRAPMNVYRFLRDENLFDGIAAMLEHAEVTWRNGETNSRLYVIRVTDNFFSVVGVPVALGRPLARGERNAVVLMHRFWQNRLSGNPDVLGRALVLDGQAYTVVGILPPNHRTLVGFGFAPDMYVPDPAEPPPPSATGAPGREEIMSFYARLPDGMTRAAAAARLRAAGEELDRIFPRVDRKWSRDVQVVAVSGLERIRSLPVMMPVTAFFAMLMMLVGLVLLIACGNVASLLVARASSRAQELAVRLSIGASRGRIFRQLLVETLLVSFLGAGAGLLLNAAATGLFNRVRFPLTIPVQLQIHMDWRLLAYSVFIAVGSALVSGLMPSLRAARADVNAVLKRHEGQVGRRHWNLRSALVVGQLAISMVLLVAALLFLRNLGKVTSMNPGFDVDHTAWAYMRLIPASYPNEEKTEAFVTAALERVRALPGVESAAIARSVPLNSNTTLAAYVSVDAKDAQRKHLQFAYNLVSPDYFRTMGIKILAGREFLLTDRPGTPRIAIINESFANLAFAGENAVGRTIRLGDDRAIMVVGVARNSKYFMLGEENRPAMYQAYFQRPFRTADMQFLVRASASPVSIVKSLNSALSNLDPTAAVEVKPMREALAMALFPGQASAVLLGSIGLLGLALASIGLYGVLLYAVSHRIREIGLRVALGASPSNVLRMVFRDSFALVAIGAALGLGLAALATRPLSMFLVPEQSTTDPAAFAGVLGVLSAVTLIATLAPASRALRVDPITALRYE